MGFELILPFLRPIEALIMDEGVSEIMVNGARRVFVERRGMVEEVPGIDLSERYLRVACQNIARHPAINEDVSEARPLLDARLPDGSRVAVVFPPCSVDGITLTIRKFNARGFTLDDLVGLGTLTTELAGLLARLVRERRNLLVSGGTGTGKTTLLNVLADLIPDEDRVIVIEDTTELRLSKPNLRRFEARREQRGADGQPDVPAVTIRDLLRAALRHRPDRIIVGEIRGGEAFDLLQALNTGHAGSLSTLHANSAPHALSRLVHCVLQSDVPIPYKAIRAGVADSIHAVVHVDRRLGRRCVSEVLSLRGYDPDTDRFDLTPLWPAAEAQPEER